MSDQPARRTIAHRKPGIIGKALIKLMMRDARVSASEALGSRFRLITLEGEELRNVAWTAGEKIQVSLGSAFTNRTYTPFNWDAAAGTTQILVFAHGDGPGSDWARNLKTGDRCHVFGPRRSLDTGALPDDLTVFGDETSIAIVKALQDARGRGVTRAALEVDSINEVEPVITALALKNTQLIERARHESLIRAVESQAGDLDGGFVLTGKAQSIHNVRGDLRALGISPRNIMTKAYWAPGKRGLE
jgi:ferric-chelate reductase (NADPH)